MKARVARSLLIGLVVLLALAPVTTALAAAPQITRLHKVETSIPGWYNCGAFQIDYFEELRGQFIEYFDNTGLPTGFKFVFSIKTTYTNNLTGKSAHGMEAGNWTEDYQALTDTYTGTPLHIVVRGEGVILHSAGRIAYDLVTGAVLFEAGQFSPFDKQLLCSALA